MPQKIEVPYIPFSLFEGSLKRGYLLYREGRQTKMNYKYGESREGQM